MVYSKELKDVTSKIKYTNFGHQKGTSLRQKVYHFVPLRSPLSFVVW
ncbi:hypothetical protein SDC9_111615 [bioreactor metagenome]|uniref:Uncharacterized protein n=1 Tax=bioreactor metagenome TaxID=1076179 RepID=A0A645BHS7_9ZZZZ